MRVLDMEVLVEEGSCQAHREVYISMDIRAGLNTILKFIGLIVGLQD